MRHITFLLLSAGVLAGCHKKDDRAPVGGCDITKVWAANDAKVTVVNGVYGTVSAMEGDCMPMIPPASSTCTHCPAQRTVRIYEYTLQTQATRSGTSSSFYDSFSTALLKEITTDADGFFQVEMPAGHYTIVTIEDGKLYASGLDGQGGLNPITVTAGKLKVNLLLTYRAVF